MHTLRFPAFFSLIWLFLAASVASGQEAVRVSTMTHSDGSRTETLTDPAAGKVVVTTYSAEGTVKERGEYKAGPDGKVNEGIFYDGTGAFLRRAMYARDPMGNVVEEAYYDQAGNILRRKQYSYGSDGRVSGIKEFGPDGRLTNSATRPVLPVTASTGSGAVSTSASGGVDVPAEKEVESAGASTGARPPSTPSSPSTPAKKKKKPSGSGRP